MDKHISKLINELNFGLEAPKTVMEIFATKNVPGLTDKVIEMFSIMESILGSKATGIVFFHLILLITETDISRNYYTSIKFTSFLEELQYNIMYGNEVDFMSSRPPERETPLLEDIADFYKQNPITNATGLINLNEKPFKHFLTYINNPEQFNILNSTAEQFIFFIDKLVSDKGMDEALTKIVTGINTTVSDYHLDDSTEMYKYDQIIEIILNQMYLALIPIAYFNLFPIENVLEEGGLLYSMEKQDFFEGNADIDKVKQQIALTEIEYKLENKVGLTDAEKEFILEYHLSQMPLYRSKISVFNVEGKLGKSIALSAENGEITFFMKTKQEDRYYLEAIFNPEIARKILEKLEITGLYQGM